jgi:hypothetical protein
MTRHQILNRHVYKYQYITSKDQVQSVVNHIYIHIQSRNEFTKINHIQTHLQS